MAVKDGDLVEVSPYGAGTVYELTDEKTVRVRFADGTSARVARQNLKPPLVRDKAIRGPRDPAPRE